MTTSLPESVGIREVSERTGLSMDTLRWYEREGILPQVHRRGDGRRRYSTYVVAFVELVQVLRRTGIPVAQIRHFVQLGGGELAYHAPRLAMLEQHAETIKERMTQLQADHAAIEKEAAHYRDMMARGQDCVDRFAEQGGNDAS